MRLREVGLQLGFRTDPLKLSLCNFDIKCRYLCYPLSAENKKRLKSFINYFRRYLVAEAGLEHATSRL